MLLLAITLESRAQSPKLVYSNSLSGATQSGNGFQIKYGGAMGTGSLANNLLTVRVTAPHGSTISSVTDNLSQSYSPATTVDSGVGGWITAFYYKAGTAAGVTQITVTYSAAVADWHGAVEEYSGIATTTPVDNFCSAHSTTISCNITTTAANDLVLATTIGLGTQIGWNRLSATGKFTAGIGFTFDAADTQDSTADEELIQASAGTVATGFTVSGSSQSFNLIGVAFKAASAGTQPTGMYILHEQHVQIGANGPNAFTTHFVSSGNLLVASMDLGPGFSTMSIDTCSPTNTWTTKTEGTLFPYFFYLTSTASLSPNLSCTVHSSNTGANGIMVIYDVVGAAPAPFDVLSSTQCQGNGGFVSCTITPTHGPGILFGAANDGTGPVTTVGTSGTAGAIFDNTPYTGETDLGQLNNGDAWQHLFYTSPATLTYTWTMQISSSYMQASGIVFDAALTPWAGIIAPTRAVNWGNAGVVGGNPVTGGLPSDSWAQCVTTACSTAFATPTAANINAAIVSAPVFSYVLLPPGTFTMSTGLVWQSKTGVELRGAGPNSTFLVFTGDNPCGGTAGDVCFEDTSGNYQGGPSNTANWTAGYSQGTTTITLSTVPNLKVGMPIILDQTDDTTDSGDIYICIAAPCATAGSGGYTRPGPPTRAQGQMVTVTQCDGNSTSGHPCSSGTNITINPGLYMPNWSSAKSPGAWWSSNPSALVGIRSVSLNHTAADPIVGTEFFNCIDCWISEVRSIMSDTGAAEDHVRLWNAPHVTVQDNYFYHTTSRGESELYGVALSMSADALVQNNIFEQVQAPVPENGPCSGCVVAYNFDVNNTFLSGDGTFDWLQQGEFEHSVADNMLFEGNVGGGMYSDNFHGTHHFVTVFRTAGDGYQKDNGTLPISGTTPWPELAFARFYNFIGNVGGSPALPATTYKTSEPTPPSGVDVFALGSCANSCGTVPNDPNVPRTIMLWGNYTVVPQSTDTPPNSGIRFVPSEVPSGITNFANPVPGNTNLPPSFYLPSQPSWWPSGAPYPAVGPDINGGNMSICLGGVNKGAYVLNASECPGSTISGLGGHANLIPAINCFLNAMGGSPIGTDAAPLAFTGKSCFTFTGSGGNSFAGNCSEPLTTSASIATQVKRNPTLTETQSTTDVAKNQAAHVANPNETNATTSAVFAQIPGSSLICIQRH